MFYNQYIFLQRWNNFITSSFSPFSLYVFVCLFFPEVFPIFRDLFYLSRVHILIQETIFSAPLKWHCSFHKNLNGATLGVILSSFNLLLFLGISDFFLTVERSITSVLPPPQELYKQSNGLIALPTSKSCGNEIAIYHYIELLYNSLKNLQ